MAKAQETKLNSKIFEGPINPEVNALYVRVYLANQRQGTVKTKTRAEVSGGGVKPFRQKGTGNARSGSKRSPVHVHGGISHGPQPKSWTLNLPAKVRRLALKSALSFKAKEGAVVLASEFEAGKTKDFVKALSALNVSGKSLIITEKHDNGVFKAGRNVAGVTVKSAHEVNAYDILNTKNVVVTEGAIKALEKRV